MTVMITGAAGFIGFHVAKRLLDEQMDVVGVDNLNAYYDPQLKEARLAQLQTRRHFSFCKADIADQAAMSEIFTTYRPQVVIHLAAQAGVRYSLEHPHAYIHSNLSGFLTILEGCRHVGVEHLLYASSSSVYGANKHVPFSESDVVDHPISLYAATKKSNECMAHAYSHLFRIPTTGLRLFTVYGPWGRPDMALFSFTKAIRNEEPIRVFNFGNMIRDFTFVSDVVEAIYRLLDKIPKPVSHPSTSSTAPARIYNIGNHQPVNLLTFIEVLEEKLGKKAIKEYLPMQAGDVPITYAKTDQLAAVIDYRPNTPIEEGISAFVEWYMSYYG